MERIVVIKSAMAYDFNDQDGKNHQGVKVGYSYKTDRPMLFGSPVDSFSCSTEAFKRYNLHEGDEVALCGAFDKGSFKVYGVYDL